MPYLFAVENADAAAGIGIVALLGAVGLLWTRLNEEKRKNKAAEQEVEASRGEERRKDHAADAAQELSLLEQATRRIVTLERKHDEDTAKIVELTGKLAACEADRVSRNKEAEWLNRHAVPDSPSGTHRPIQGTEGADL